MEQSYSIRAATWALGLASLFSPLAAAQTQAADTARNLDLLHDAQARSRSIMAKAQDGYSVTLQGLEDRLNNYAARNHLDTYDRIVFLDPLQADAGKALGLTAPQVVQALLEQKAVKSYSGLNEALANSLFLPMDGNEGVPGYTQMPETLFFRSAEEKSPCVIVPMPENTISDLLEHHALPAATLADFINRAQGWRCLDTVYYPHTSIDAASFAAATPQALAGDRALLEAYSMQHRAWAFADIATAGEMVREGADPAFIDQIADWRAWNATSTLMQETPVFLALKAAIAQEGVAHFRQRSETEARDLYYRLVDDAALNADRLRTRLLFDSGDAAVKKDISARAGQELEVAKALAFTNKYAAQQKMTEVINPQTLAIIEQLADWDPMMALKKAVAADGKGFTPDTMINAYVRLQNEFMRQAATDAPHAALPVEQATRLKATFVHDLGTFDFAAADRAPFAKPPATLSFSPGAAAEFDPAFQRDLQMILLNWIGGKPLAIISSRDLGTPHSPQTLAKVVNATTGGAFSADNQDADQQLRDMYVVADKNGFGASAAANRRLVDVLLIPDNISQLERTVPALLANLPPALLTRMPGNARDWTLIVLAHEIAGHIVKREAMHADKGGSIQHNLDLWICDKEIGGDERGIAGYLALPAQGFAADPAVAAAFADMRAIGTLRNSSDDISVYTPETDGHATSAAYRVTGTTIEADPVVTAAGIEQAILRVNTASHLLLGLYGPRPDKKAVKAAVNDLVTQGGALSMLGQFFNRKQGDGRSKLMTDITSDPAGLKLVTLATAGAKTAQADPGLQYASLKMLLDHDLLQTPLERRIARDFVTAFARHAPEAAIAPSVLAFTAKVPAAGLTAYLDRNPQARLFIERADALAAPESPVPAKAAIKGGDVALALPSP